MVLAAPAEKDEVQITVGEFRHARRMLVIAGGHLGTHQPLDLNVPRGRAGQRETCKTGP